MNVEDVKANKVALFTVALEVGVKVANLGLTVGRYSKPVLGAAPTDRVAHSYMCACLFRLLQRLAVEGSGRAHSGVRLGETEVEVGTEFGWVKLSLVRQPAAEVEEEGKEGGGDRPFLDWLAQVCLHHSFACFHAHFKGASAAAPQRVRQANPLPPPPPPDIMEVLCAVLGRYVFEAVAKKAIREVKAGEGGERVESRWANAPIAGGLVVCAFRGAKGGVADLYCDEKGVRVFVDGGGEGGVGEPTPTFFKAACSLRFFLGRL